MTLGRDRLYAALTGLMHGGLTVYPARWAGLRHIAPLALQGGAAIGNLASRVGLEHVALLALWDRRETRSRQSRLLGWAEAYNAVGVLVTGPKDEGLRVTHSREICRAAGALVQAHRAVIPQPKAAPWVCEYPQLDAA
jgi:hypothetical protein